MAINKTYKQLAQRLPNSTATMILYNPPSGTQNSLVTSFINTLIICNVTGSAATYSIWINPNGNVSGDQFALIKNIPVAANASDQRIYPESSGLILVRSTASILISASVANALNFTIFGYEVVES